MKKNSGCMAIAIAFGVLLVLLGAWSVSMLLGLWSDEPESGADPAPPANVAGASPPIAECAADTAAFRGFAGPRAGVQEAVLNNVTLVCWQPSGELRVEARYPADINAASAPMTWLCTTLYEFVASSGKPPQGFTVHSAHAATQGKPLLVGNANDRSCTNPQHRR